jgi:hypothetical protein
MTQAEALYESLRRAASPASTTALLHNYTFGIPAVDNVSPGRGLGTSYDYGKVSYPPTLGNGTGSLLPRSPPGVASSALAAVSANSPSGSAVSAGDIMPQEIEECYAVIRFQRAQITQLRSRAAALEDQLSQVCLCLN